jgi:DnaK suppressor protein
MHYHYFTLEQRQSLEALMRERMAGQPELDSALRRLRTPDYGVCAACGSDIPYIRLLGDPVARRCEACEANSS